METICVAARESPLSCAQVHEVLCELNAFHPCVKFDLKLIKTKGDLDLSTSLRDMDKTDFFTKELDVMLIRGDCQAAVHSAKDLPDPLPAGLCLAALTKGVDSSDSLVLRQGETLESLPAGAVIATSSARREEAVASLRADLTFVDIRGTIGERLKQVENGSLHGVVIAEAALIRLNLTHLNRIKLPGDTAPLQGKLAVLVRSGDIDMIQLFSSIDSRCVSSTSV